MVLPGHMAGSPRRHHRPLSLSIPELISEISGTNLRVPSPPRPSSAPSSGRHSGALSWAGFEEEAKTRRPKGQERKAAAGQNQPGSASCRSSTSYQERARVWLAPEELGPLSLVPIGPSPEGHRAPATERDSRGPQLSHTVPCAPSPAWKTTEAAFCENHPTPPFLWLLCVNRGQTFLTYLTSSLCGHQMASRSGSGSSQLAHRESISGILHATGDRSAINHGSENDGGFQTALAVRRGLFTGDLASRFASHPGEDVLLAAGHSLKLREMDPSFQKGANSSAS
ncbi:unnamed protein product [Rangifer tarandus platyrhynchus]|uniref:Uncharacterized protein n=2 Tax=Rangifer tarandus platyrhynchus TaxID=3082113 RepID=A0ABN8ZIY0_RANTA|nr:unnamed protein product [Rangifer tarandus platyrhynchus]CAI9708367.1 unnamed protein product [Rangifer tarandus platyrhynchus]